MCTKKNSITSQKGRHLVYIQHQGKQLLRLVRSFTWVKFLSQFISIFFFSNFWRFLYLTQSLIPYLILRGIFEMSVLYSFQRGVTFLHNFLTIPLYITFVCPSTLFCSFCRRSAADLTSSFLAVTWRAGSLTLPLVSFSRRTLTTRSCPCCRATARGVNPS